MESKAEVVIIGGGVTGLSTAYNLALRRVNDVVVLEKSYLGSGGSGRNAGGIRAQYDVKENILLAKASRDLAEKISAELNFNIMFRQKGYLYLAFDESEFSHLKRVVGLQNTLGVDTKVLSPKEAKNIAPCIDDSNVVGASFNNKDGIARHDAVVWGYARAAQRMGVRIHSGTEVRKIEASKGKVEAVLTDKGRVEAEYVVNAAGAFSKEISSQLGVDLPIFAAKREILVTEALKPFLDPMVINLHTAAYYNQTDRGEVVCSFHHGHPGETPTYNTASTLSFLEEIANEALTLIPALKTVKVMRQWAGTYDLTPDASPILGEVDGVEGLIQASGFSGAGFKLCHIVGRMLAELIATGRTPELIRPFSLDRFKTGKLLTEAW